MKKVLLILALVAAVAFAFGYAGNVLAQTVEPPIPAPNNGWGMMGGFGRGGMMGAGFANYGEMHDDMVQTFADELGMSVDEVNARLAAGDSMYTLAAEKGMTAEDFSKLMSDFRAQELDEAVADGTITQEQADFMKERGAGIMGGRGRSGNFGGCPFYDQNEN